MSFPISLSLMETCNAPKLPKKTKHYIFSVSRSRHELLGWIFFAVHALRPSAHLQWKAVEPHWALIGSQQLYYHSQSHLLAASSCAAPTAGFNG